MPISLDISAIDSLIRDVAATEIMPRFRKLAAGDVEMKGVNDPVTVADKESERALTERLTALLPGSVVVGEESFAKDKTVMDRLDAGKPVWIVDPIDGTRNFVAGHPEFAVMVALVRDRQGVAAWIHDPNTGDTVMGEQGAGVWLRGERLRLAAADPSVRTVGLVGSRVKKYLQDSPLSPRADEMPETEIGSCAGFDYPRLFEGPARFANRSTTRASFLFYRHTNPWDHAAGLFLHHEAGGYSADWSGRSYDMTDRLAGLLLAVDRAAWERLHALFAPLMEHIAKKIA